MLRLFTNIGRPEYTKTALSLVQGLTSNKDLQTVMLYSWGDYGTQPSKTNFLMQSLLNRHFLKFGAHYLVGGASEIAFNIIPVIQRSGGEVLVSANVCEILIEGGNIISNAGLYNTFQKLLQPTIARRSYYLKICKNLKPGNAAMNVFLGLNKNAEELGLQKQSTLCAASSGKEHHDRPCPAQQNNQGKGEAGVIPHTIVIEPLKEEEIYALNTFVLKR